MEAGVSCRFKSIGCCNKVTAYCESGLGINNNVNARVSFLPDNAARWLESVLVISV